MKVLFDTVGIKSAALEDKFLFQGFADINLNCDFRMPSYCVGVYMKKDVIQYLTVSI